MGWFIQEGENTVKVSKKCAKELFKSQEYEGELWEELDEVLRGDKLHFNTDHMEHMDWLSWHTPAVDVLKKYKVEGRICFESHEGDNAGEYWGYVFDGKGGMVELVGEVTLRWVPKKSE